MHVLSEFVLPVLKGCGHGWSNDVFLVTQLASKLVIVYYIFYDLVAPVNNAVFAYEAILSGRGEPAGDMPKEGV